MQFNVSLMSCSKSGVLKPFFNYVPFLFICMYGKPLKLVQNKVYAIEKTKRNNLFHTFNAIDDLDVLPLS